MADYRSAGVDLDGHAALMTRIRTLAARATRAEVVGGVGLFAGAFRQADGGVLAASTDSVGTKVLLACACGRHREMGLDVVVHCANDVATTGAEPLFFLDYLAVHAIEADTAAQIVDGVADACGQAGCALLGGETAQMPDLYRPGTYDLAGTMVGRAAPERFVHPSGRAGDLVVGIPSSGLHTNGFSLVRRILADTGTAPEARPDLLAPSRLYSGDVLRLQEAGVDIRGLAHITGGGLAGNLDRALPADVDAVVDTSAWPRPEVFRWIQDLGAVAEEEMRRVFNLGIGFCVVVPRDAADAACRCAAGASVIGELAAGTGKVVVR